MTTSLDSRYYGSQVRMADSNGIYQQSSLRTIAASSNAVSLYVWKEVDRPDVVAAAILGDSSSWWMIFDVNPEVIDPLNVPAGSILRIPNTQSSTQATLVQ